MKLDSYVLIHTENNVEYSIDIYIKTFTILCASTYKNTVGTAVRILNLSTFNTGFTSIAVISL